MIDAFNINWAPLKRFIKDKIKKRQKPFYEKKKTAGFAFIHSSRFDLILINQQAKRVGKPFRLNLNNENFNFFI